MSGHYVFTPARRAAQRKASAASARARKGRKREKANLKYPSHGERASRGVGLAGVRANFTPYTRINKRSQTVGVNTGSIIPGTKKRLVFGGYIRLEGTTNKTAVDTAINKAVVKAAPKGTKRAKALDIAKSNVTVQSPKVRVRAGNHEARLGTSRGAGPTLILRRGTHKVATPHSARGVDQYNKGVRKRKAKKQRAERREVTPI